MSQYDIFSVRLENGKEFQDYAAWQLCKAGIVVNLFTSDEFQAKIGESISGIEIKLDRGIAKYGNCYFEFEKRKGPTTEWYPAFWAKEDHSWLYVTGDENDLYIFSKEQIQSLCKNCQNNPEVAERYNAQIKHAPSGEEEFATARGWTISLEKLKQFHYVLKHIAITKEA